jgi:hypothetical protein
VLPGEPWLFQSQKRVAKRFHEADLRYAASQLQIPFEVVKVEQYAKKSFYRHRWLIAEHLGFELYSKASEAKILPELQTLIRSQKRPKVIFEHLAESLIRQRIEVPRYFALATLILREVQTHKQKLLGIVRRTLTEDQQGMLEKLLEQEQDERKKVQRYHVTLLKRFSQSIKPKKIQETLEDVKLLGTFYHQLAGVLEGLDLPPEGLRHYAQFVINAKIFQVTRREKDDQYLHLLAFVAHQFFRGQDLLVDILLKSTQSIVNTVKREHKEHVFEHRWEVRRSLKRLRQGLRSPLASIEAITHAPDLTAEEKLAQIQAIFKLIHSERGLAETELDLLDGQSKVLLEDAEYYDLLEAASRKLQNRVADIVKFLDFGGTDKPLLAAILHFQEKTGVISHTAPCTFLRSEVKALLVDDNGNFRVSLYKSLLFIHIAEALKAGRLHLKHSYKYRSLDDYLIPVEKWQTKKAAYLEQAGMSSLADWSSVERTPTQQLDAQYRQTNQGILDGRNEHLNLRKNNSFVLKTPKLEQDTS